MNRLTALCLIVTISCVGLFSNSLKAQLFERTIGSPVNNEISQDGKPIPDGKYIMLSNTLSYGPASMILLTRLNASGNVDMYATLHDPANPLAAYFGTAIELDKNANGAHTGYFITGYRTTTSGSQIILLRTNLNGTLTWAKFLPQALTTNDERGVSVERQSNGDVTVVGRFTDVTNNVYKFMAARFNSNGGQIWSYRYSAGVGFTGTGCEAVEACNGFRSGAAVIAVTGRANKHTFLSCIDAATGNEIWRQVYNSGYSNDEGLDVVYKPANGAAEPERFMVVGSAAIGHSVMWVVRVNPQNGAASCKTYTPGLFYSSFVANAVSLDVSGTKAAIAGRIFAQIMPNIVLNGTFVMVLPFFGTELPDWTYYYEDSRSPVLDRASISRITGAAGGHFITCGAQLTASGFSDLHAIRINSSGSSGTGCARISVPTTRTLVGTATAITFSKTAATWTSLVLTRTARSYSQQNCTGLLVNDERSEETEDSTLVVAKDFSEPRLFPNPATLGQTVRLAFDLPELGDLRVCVFNLTGDEVWSGNETFEKGAHELELPAHLFAKGSYLVQLQSERQNKVLKLFVLN